MRRSSSNSITSLTIEYGMPTFICIPNLSPSFTTRWGVPFASRTLPEPSISR